MIFREANIQDINDIQIVRNAVKENILSNPALVTNEMCREYLTIRGKGWGCEVEGELVGFSIVDLKEENVWALFVHPDFEKLGIGRKLHDLLLDWYFNQNKTRLWLSTDPNTRAEIFYIKSGWSAIGLRENGEMKFEMNAEAWRERKHLT